MSERAPFAMHGRRLIFSPPETAGHLRNGMVIDAAVPLLDIGTSNTRLVFVVRFSAHQSGWRTRPKVT